MAIKEILILGNPALYETCETVQENEVSKINALVRDLHDTLINFKKNHGTGRAIAAPQIGVQKRVFYMFIDKPVVFINPVIDLKSNEMMTLWDDCMSFPELLVKVRRHKSCRITFKNQGWEDRSMTLNGDLSELIQHEYDHLDGILAVTRAVDKQAFSMKSENKN